MRVTAIEPTTDTLLDGETARWEVLSTPGTDPNTGQVPGFVRIVQREQWPHLTTIALFSDADPKAAPRLALHFDTGQLAELVSDLVDAGELMRPLSESAQ